MRYNILQRSRACLCFISGHEQTRDVFAVHDTVKSVPGRTDEAAQYDVYFEAKDLPPMGYKTYLLVQSIDGTNRPHVKTSPIDNGCV